MSWDLLYKLGKHRAGSQTRVWASGPRPLAVQLAASSLSGVARAGTFISTLGRN